MKNEIATEIYEEMSVNLKMGLKKVSVIEVPRFHRHCAYFIYYKLLLRASLVVEAMPHHIICICIILSTANVPAQAKMRRRGISTLDVF